jgi:hypothetical protein
MREQSFPRKRESSREARGHVLSALAPAVIPAQAGIPRLSLTALIICCLCLLTSCAVPKGPVYTENGKEYGVTHGTFRGTWWNFYERGNSYAEGGYWEDAIRDYEEALKGRSRDQRSARTYGLLNYIDYFPHRELGVAYYHLERYEQAVSELERSLEDTESAKAKYYLNRSRKAILLRDRKDTRAPTIRVSSPRQSEMVREFEVEVEGEVSDDFFVAALWINDEALPVELAQPSVRFRYRVLLGRDDTEIRIESEDLVGRRTVEIVTLLVDREGPQLGIDEILCSEPIACKEVTVRGYVDDASEIVWVSIGGKRVTAPNLSSFGFEETILLDQATRKVFFATEDIVGNRTEGDIRISPPERHTTVPDPARGDPIRLAHLENVRHVFDFGSTSYGRGFAEEEITGLTGQTRLARSIGDWTLAGRDTTAKEDYPPVIELKDLAEEQPVYYDTLYIEGNVSGSTPIRSLLVNERPIQRRPSRKFFFSHFVKLNPGENTITLRAEDEQGNTSERTILILYVVPKVHQIHCRLRVAVLPFALRGEHDLLRDYVYDALLNSFVVQGRFRIVDRADLDKIVFELGIGQSELADPKTAARVGLLAASEAVVCGSVYEGERSLEVFAQLLDLETSEIILARDVYEEDKNLATIRKMSQGLALKFKQAMPVIEGEVVKLKGQDVYTDLGAEERILRGMRILLFREGEMITHPRTGKPLGCDALELGEAVVKGVFDQMSVGTLIEERKKQEVNPLDRAITK